MGMGARFDVAKLEADMARKGWLPTDLAREAGVSNMSVSRVLKGQRRNPRTVEKLAAALGFSIRRYVIQHSEAGVGA